MTTREPALEFSRPLLVARVPSKGCVEHVKAEPKECLRLAKRINVPIIESLTARMEIRPWRGGGLKIKGTVDATLEQVSVISLETFTSTVKFDINRYFLPHGSSRMGPEDDGDEDIDEIRNGEIDLGEIAAETLALELDPYPRKDGEEFPETTEDSKPAAVIRIRKD
jgi:hypothetical protein